MHVHIHGAGVFGCTAALELRARGHDVVLVDPGPLPHPDAASTDRSKLVRPDYGDDGFLQGLMEAALPGWHAWNARFDRPLFHPTGLHVLSSDWAPGTFEHDSFSALPDSRPFDDVRDAVPNTPWARELKGYTSPRSGWVESGAVVLELIGWCTDVGIPVLGEPPSEEPDWTVWATGAWLPSHRPDVADRIRPTGQPSLLFAPEDPDRFRPPHFLPWCCDIAQTGWYGFPAGDDGIVKIANHGPGTPTDPQGPRTVAPVWHDIFRTFLSVHLPELADAPVVGTRLCLYADSFDGDFFIARHPAERVVFAGGGSGHAFKFAPVLGELTANAVEGVKDPRLARFAWRDLGESRSERARFASSR